MWFEEPDGGTGPFGNFPKTNLSDGGSGWVLSEDPDGGTGAFGNFPNTNSTGVAAKATGLASAWLPPSNKTATAANTRAENRNLVKLLFIFL